MATQVSYPGVYIEEFTPAAPIQGVGTSTAAFIGVAKYGPPNEPTKLTSWDGYLKKFSDPNAVPDDTDYLWYAVRGFFENGGKVCFVTAVSNASYDSFTLKDAAAAANPATAVRDTIVVRARTTGQQVPPITVTPAEAHIVSAGNLYAPSATIDPALNGALSITVATAGDAAKFRAGDDVRIGTAANNQPAVVQRIDDKTIFLTAGLTAARTGKVTLYLKQFTNSFRVENADGLTSGSIITLKQGAGAAAKTQVTVVRSVTAERIATGVTTYRIDVQDGLQNGPGGFELYGAGQIGLQSEEFSLSVAQGGPPTTYPDLSMSPGHPRYFATVINNDPARLIEAQSSEPPSNTALPFNRPRAQLETLVGGENHDPTKIKASHYKAAIKLLAAIDDINMVVAPGVTDQDVQVAVIDHCANMQDRFAILDSVRGAEPFGTGSVETQRKGLENDNGVAALYYPWLEVGSELTSKRILVPPSGAIAGVYARTDLTRGVFKAPAGTQSIVNGALGVEKMLSDVDQGQLNLQGINVIRVFQFGGRPVVWGARTTSSNTNWQYVNIRRLFLFLEESIQEGIRGAVFEPNNEALWQKLKRTINAFLTQQWRDGALFGETPQQAFYVRIDEVLNPESERALGRLTIEIGVRPAYPAEFIVVRIGLWQGGAEVTES